MDSDPVKNHQQIKTNVQKVDFVVRFERAFFSRALLDGFGEDLGRILEGFSKDLGILNRFLMDFEGCGPHG